MVSREVIKKDNFFSVEMKDGEQLTLAVDGEITLSAIAPCDCTLNCYMKRDQVSFQFK